MRIYEGGEAGVNCWFLLCVAAMVPGTVPRLFFFASRYHYEIMTLLLGSLIVMFVM